VLIHFVFLFTIVWLNKKVAEQIKKDEAQILFGDYICHSLHFI